MLSQEAFLLSVKTLKATLCALTAESDSGAKDGRRDEDEAVRTESVLMRLKESVNDIIVFCHRSCQGLEQKQREVGAVRGHVCSEELTASYCLFSVSHRFSGFHFWTR